MVNTRRTEEVLSISETRTKEQMYVQNNNNLMEQVIERSNIKKAFKRVRSNKGAPGIDGMQTEKLCAHLEKNWLQLKEELLEGTYKPSSVRGVEIPKPDGGVRQLGIPTVLDRFIQQAIQQVLTRIFDPQFSKESYGFRPKHSARQAVELAQRHIQRGRHWVVDIDLEKFFDKVNHDILMYKLSREVKDKRILRIIRRYLEAGVMLNGVCARMEAGTPQGGPLSPLLANIMLNDLDKELSKRGHLFVRYADDCNIYVSSNRAGQRVFASVSKFIKDRLMLKVNAKKSAVDVPWKRKFLGFSFYRTECSIKICVALKSLERFKERIRQLTKRNVSMNIKTRVRKLNEYLIGWSGYFALAENRGKFQGLDGWIRRRLRMCLLKQWKRGKTKLRNLKQLGIEEKWAGRIAYSRKMCWRLANTPQINKALDNAYWQNQGLIRLVDCYYKVRMTI